MIRVNRQVDYALQLLTALGKVTKDEVLSLREFSRESTISFLLLQKIAKSLREAGLVSAERGPYGGYLLQRPLEQIQLKEVIEAIEGPFGISSCTKPGASCCHEAHCTIRRGAERLQARVAAIFEETSVADFLDV
jgi:Rrf2 family protein